MTDKALSAQGMRAALESLSRDTLAEVTGKLELAVADRRAQAAHVEAILAAKGVLFGDVLRLLSRDELKAICAALGLDTSGKEKEAIVQRILGGEAGAREKLDLEVVEKAPRKKVKQVQVPLKPRAFGEKEPGAQAGPEGPFADYRHDATRKNNPPAGLVDLDRPPARPTRSYAYDPHLDPQLQWAGKAEHTSFEVDTVSLHIHERISSQAILKAAKREDAQRDLFAETALPESKLIDFYAHDVGWANRLILGDSLLVMNSLLEREQMAGKVQCIYIDPPYGVKFNSNFQPSISRRDVKDADDGSLTREPEQIQAYRDTWTLGIHSYLTYLRDRLLLAKELLSESGSIFLQISEENLGSVVGLLGEVLGPGNQVAIVPFRKKTMPLGSKLIEQIADFILWYCKDIDLVKYRKLFMWQDVQGDNHWNYLELPDGSRRRMSEQEINNHSAMPKDSRVYQLIGLYPAGFNPSGLFEIQVGKKTYSPPSGKSYATTKEGMLRLLACKRIEPYQAGDTLRYVLFHEDYPVTPLTAMWGDSSAPSDKVYAVQTSTEVIKRCILMSTDPGDLVFDPTCGSGTTAFVAEQWGRRWITCDTSRVALAIARQRLLTSKFPFFKLRSERVKDGFIYKTVPHITLKSIAQNPKLDECKTQEERERVIRESAEQETLYDQPEEDRSKVRVSGPFTVEAIPTASMEDPFASEALEPDARKDDIARRRHQEGRVLDVGGDYVTFMIDLMRKSGGVHFKGGKSLPVSTLRPVKSASEWFHAESETGMEGDPRRVAVSFGPRHAPVTPKQVLEAISQTRGYDILLFVGFACDPEAHKMIDQGAPGRELQFVHAAPDILVTDLLKTSKTTKLFTVFGLPDVKVHKEPKGAVSVELRGVDLYDPLTGETDHDQGETVAAWFLDHDYDGRTFLVCQAFFPGGKQKNPWEKLQKALKGVIDEDKFEALRSTRSIPFTPGKKIAVKVIDDRGNEVVKVVSGQV